MRAHGECPLARCEREIAEAVANQADPAVRADPSILRQALLGELDWREELAMIDVDGRA